MPAIGAPELILVIVVLLLLFGARKLPELARSMGRSTRIFKSEIREGESEEDRQLEAQEDPGTKPAGRKPAS